MLKNDITSHFTDAALKEYIISNFSKDGKTIKKDDISNIISLDVKELEITNLSGIEYFLSLEELDCSFNMISNLDTTPFRKLKTLKCKANKLTKIEINSNTKLSALDCSFNNLLTIDVSQNKALKTLICAKNQLKELDLANNKELEDLDFSFNQLANIDISKNKKLTKLACNSNRITHIDLSKNIALEYLDTCYGNNKIPHLDLSKNIALKGLECSSNDLVELDLSHNPLLEELRCTHNNLTNLDVSHNPQLKWLHCTNNNIMTLDVSHNPLLEDLHCSYNLLLTLDVSHNPLLKNLSHTNNYMVQPEHTIRGIGTFTWNNDFSCYEYTLNQNGKNIFISIEVGTKTMIKNMSSHIKKIIDNMDTLEEEICHQIKKEFPKADKSNLNLEVLNVHKDKSFQLGCNAGDSPAGQLYIYLNFDKNFVIDDQIICETY